MMKLTSSVTKKNNPKNKDHLSLMANLNTEFKVHTAMCSQEINSNLFKAAVILIFNLGVITKEVRCF